MDDFLNQQYPAGLLSTLGINPEDLRRQQQQAGLLSAGLQLLAGSGYSPVRQTTGQLLGQAGMAGVQGMQQAGESAIERALRGMQVSEFSRRQQEADRLRQARESYGQRMRDISAGVVTPSMALSGGGGPTQAAAAQIGQPINAAQEQQRAAMEFLGQAYPEELAKMSFREPKQAPGVVGEYQAALSLGLIPKETTLQQFAGEIKKPLVSNVIGGKVDPFEEAAMKKQADVFSGIQESATKASRSLQSVNRLESILNKVETGGVAAFKQIAGNFGVPTKGLSDIQAAQSIINKMVPEQRPVGSGTMSDADLVLYKQSLPRIINQPGGNKLIIQSMREINQYLIDEGKIANDVLDKKITPAEGRRKLLELGNPIQNFFDKNPALVGGAAQGMSQQDMDLINKYRKKP
jgi:hypothetical protein